MDYKSSFFFGRGAGGWGGGVRNLFASKDIVMHNCWHVIQPKVF